MSYKEKMDREWEEEQEKYLKDIEICKALLDTLKTDYKSPGVSWMFNKSKIARTRLMIHDLLKKY